jgi:5'-3' exonuclease
MRLHLLDATYELFRAHFGFPPRDDPSGRPVGAVVGLMETTLQLLREEGVTHLGAATDTVIRSFRNDLYDGYKTGEGVEPELLAQFPLAERALEAMGVRTWRMEDFEADDAMATAAIRWADDVDQVVILSPDKDLTQVIVEDRIVAFNRRTRTLMDEAGVWEKFGVGPASIPDYLALVGDTADGIPGLPRWGAKSSATLLARYGSIDAIPRDETTWDVTVRGAAALGASLREHEDDLRLFRTLTTLRLDAPITESLADLEWRGVRRDPYLALCDELGVEGLRERPHLWA